MQNKVQKTKRGLTPDRVRGFTLFVAIIVMGTLLLIATGVVNLALKQSSISRFARESQHAFYAADTGIECALYWDIANPSGVSAFDPSASQTRIECNNDSGNNNPDNYWNVGGSSVTVIGDITFFPDPYCATVTITKNPGQTIIESLGYNTCASNTGRVERAVRVTYTY